MFLRNISATVIPSLALPVSIVGTFTVMYLLGYSLDNLSLMALTLSVGFVVDDAIVMLENIVRHMEMGKSPMQAAFDGSKEIAFTILSMTVSLAAVFIPVLFMGGIVGRLLHEFAVTIAVGDPGLRLRVDQPDADAVQPLPEAAARAAHGWLYNGTRARLRRLARASTTCTLRLRAAAPRGHDGRVGRAASPAPSTCSSIVPKGFLPSEDQGRFTSTPRRAQGISFDDMVRHQLEVADDRRCRIRTSPAPASTSG